MTRRALPLLLVLVFLAAGLGVPGPARGQAAPPGQTAVPPGEPDVLALVYVLPGGAGQLDFTYARTVPHAQARADLQALLTAAGWTARDVKITDAPPPVTGATQKMTSVEFKVAGAVDPAAGTLPVAPFAQAFRSYDHLVVTYLADDGYRFSGLRQYSDDRIQVSLDQRGHAYTYQVLIRDHRLTRLDLPAHQAAPEAGAGRKPKSINPWLAALVALAAVGTGCAVYTAMSRHS